MITRHGRQSGVRPSCCNAGSGAGRSRRGERGRAKLGRRLVRSASFGWNAPIWVGESSADRWIPEAFVLSEHRCMRSQRGEAAVPGSYGHSARCPRWDAASKVRTLSVVARGARSGETRYRVAASSGSCANPSVFDVAGEVAASTRLGSVAVQDGLETCPAARGGVAGRGARAAGAGDHSPATGGPVAHDAQRLHEPCRLILPGFRAADRSAPRSAGLIECRSPDSLE